MENIENIVGQVTLLPDPTKAGDLYEGYQATDGSIEPAVQFSTVDFSDSTGPASIYVGNFAQFPPFSESATINGITQIFGGPASVVSGIPDAIHGTNHGDFIQTSFSYSAQMVLYTGTGDDTINNLAGNDVDEHLGMHPNHLQIVYTGGNDVISNSYCLGAIRLWEGITFDDLTIHNPGRNPASGYVTVTIDVHDLGTLTLNGLTLDTLNQWQSTITLDGGGSIKLLSEGGFTYTPGGPTSTVHGTWGDDTWNGRFGVSGTYYGLGGDDHITATGADNHLYGGAGDDTLAGWTGNNLLAGGPGNDVYLYDSYGHNVLTDTDGDDAILMDDPGIHAGQISESRVGDDLVLNFEHPQTDTSTPPTFTGSNITVTDFYSDTHPSTIDTLHFINGGADIDLRSNTTLHSTVIGSDTGETLDLSESSDQNAFIYGLGGDDTIYGTGNNDHIYGGDGNDTLYGTGGNDVLDGGQNINALAGGEGNDSYVLSDTAFNTVSDSQGINRVYTDQPPPVSYEMRNGTLTLKDADGTAYAALQGDFATITFGDGSVLSLNDIYIGHEIYYHPTEGNDNIDLEEDGTSGDFAIDLLGGNDEYQGSFFSDIVNGGDGNDALAGGGGDDVLNGGAGIDDLEGGQGNDILDGGSDGGAANYANDYDAISGVTVDLSHGITSNDGYGTTDRLLNIESVLGSNFADSITGDNDDNQLYGLAGNDIINGLGGDDYISGGAGDDILNGGSGNDTYVLRAGDGFGDVIQDSGGFDTLRISGGLTIADVSFARSGNDLVMTYDDAVTIKDFYSGNPDNVVEKIQFDDYTTFDLTTLLNTIPPPTNQAPTPQDDSLTLAEDTTLHANVLADNGHGADTDPDGDSLSITPQNLVTAHGGQVALAANGDVTYIPAANFNGTDSFTYTESDPSGAQASATVNLTITPVNDAPIAVSDHYTIAEDHALTGNFLTNDTDIDHDSLSAFAQALSSPNGGNGFISADGSFSYMPAPDFNGNDSFSYTVSDGHGGTATAEIDIAVTPVNDTPVAAPDHFDAPYLDTILGNLLADNGNGVDHDPDGDVLSIQPGTIETADGASVALEANGQFTYTPNTGAIGPDRFTYTLEDGHGGTTTGIATLDIAAKPGQILGTPGDDHLKVPHTCHHAAAQDATIAGFAGNDVLHGGHGNDTLIGGQGDDRIYGSNGNDTLYGDDVLLSQHKFSADNILYPHTMETINIANLNPDGTPNLGILHGDLESNTPQTATLTFVQTVAGYDNSLGSYTIGADGTIENAHLEFSNLKHYRPGDTQTLHLPGTPDSEFGFFIIANGAELNHNYSCLNLNSDDLKFYYDYGQSDQRLAKITDSAHTVSLVYDDGHHTDALQGNIYHTTERGTDSLNLNPDGEIHAISGLTSAGNTASLRIGFEDLSGTGDADYNDAVFDIKMNPTARPAPLTGGDDTLNGGNGDDILAGGQGNNSLTGGSGADTFMLSTTNGIDTVKDFHQYQGDRLDIHNLISEIDPLTQAISDFVHMDQQGANTIVSVDTTGTGQHFAETAILQHTHGLNVDDLFQSGDLIV